MLTVTRTTDFDGLTQLQAVWNELLARTASNTIALTWEWLATWWQVFNDNRELFILVVRDGDEVIGIAPLLKRQAQHYGVSYWRLEFLASGEEVADEICSPYLDFMLHRGREAEALEAIINYLRESAAGWDEIVLSSMLAESPNVALLESISAACGLHYSATEQESAYYLPLITDWEAQLAQSSRPLRQKIRREQRAAEANGVVWRIADQSDNFAENFEILVNLHQARWTSRGEPGVFASKKFTAFHQRLAPQLLEQGWVKLFILFIADAPVSALYTFVYNQKVFYYQSGLAPVESNLFSPGTLNLSYAQEKAIEWGLTEWDFLQGGQAYKARWHTQPRPLVQVRLARPQAKELLYNATAQGLQVLRQVKKSLKPLPVSEAKSDNS